MSSRKPKATISSTPPWTETTSLRKTVFDVLITRYCCVAAAEVARATGGDWARQQAHVIEKSFTSLTGIRLWTDAGVFVDVSEVCLTRSLGLTRRFWTVYQPFFVRREQTLFTNCGSRRWRGRIDAASVPSSDLLSSFKSGDQLKYCLRGAVRSCGKKRKTQIRTEARAWPLEQTGKPQVLVLFATQ